MFSTIKVYHVTYSRARCMFSKPCTESCSLSYSLGISEWIYFIVALLIANRGVGRPQTANVGNIQMHVSACRAILSVYVYYI